MVIKYFYGDDGGFNSESRSLGSGGIWTDIIKAVNSVNTIDEDFEDSFIRNISNGNNTSFWNDPWCGDGTRLSEAFPRLYALETSKDCFISDRWHMDNDSGVGTWSWSRPLRGRANDDLASLISRIGTLQLNRNGADKWTWSLDASGSFKIKSLSKRIQTFHLAEFIINDHYLWNSLVPRKVNICSWRASLNRLPTRANLNLRGVNMGTYSCPVYVSANVRIYISMINLLISALAKFGEQLELVDYLPRPASFPSFSIKDIANGNVGSNGSFRTSKVMHGVFLTTLWSIWNRRNKIVHAQPEDVRKIMGEDIFPAIQRLSMNWISARMTSFPANWNNWIAKPFDLFS
ncbi:RNA-directed DNA polymerase, eukaryota, reverse transcriptase zinc-binding domain protein [Tanacetum coccineum]|uniref:RNA-directed DNA polymerase, eukaryota, reverse transcriptase zinc-binding domain protein n=1 Tax=Tanacetum coccineum TaxID=301880 RepID=A0ABQ5BX34_9ASTR